jgi:opacity protein-like surface antigen
LSRAVPADVFFASNFDGVFSREFHLTITFNIWRTNLITRKWLFLWAVLMLTPLMTSAQVAPAQSGSKFSLALGAGFSGFDTDYAPHRMYGITAYGDMDYGRWIGLEVEGRTIQWNKFGRLREDTIAAGGRVRLPRYGRLTPYVKFLGGIASIDFPPHVGFPNYTHDTYTFYDAGGGLDYKLTHHVYFRGDYEYEWWPQWPKNGLTPNGFTIGANYRF